MGVTSIEWTDRAWNPLTGCTKVSPGCDHCYAKTMHERFHGPGSFDTVTLHPDRLAQPLRWRKPSRVFVNSMSDLFHADVPDEYIAQVFAVMALASQHTFQVLTKRHARMRSLLADFDFWPAVQRASRPLANDRGLDWLESLPPARRAYPLPNVWLGVSVENQQWADIRIPALLDTPAAVRFLSCEPLLGPVDLRSVRPPRMVHPARSSLAQIDWVIVGGESGPGARPMHPDWARSLRDQCVAAGVPFLFKQWGSWAPTGFIGLENRDDPERHHYFPLPVGDGGRFAGPEMRRVGKKAAGRELDGRTWDEYPVSA